MMSGTDEVTRNYILYFVIPLWFAAGFADYVCHRATRIEHTSGWRESALHCLMLLEMSIPVTLALHLKITAAVVLTMIVMFLVHEATAIWDIWFAQPRREVSAIESHIHSYLAVLPFMVGSMVICVNRSQFLPLFGMGPESADFSLQWKDPPLPWPTHVGLIVGSIVLLAGPYAEELWRCYRADRRLAMQLRSNSLLAVGSADGQQ